MRANHIRALIPVLWICCSTLYAQSAGTDPAPWITTPILRQPRMGTVWSAAFSPDNRLIATGHDGGVMIWRAGTGDSVALLGGFRSRVTAVTFDTVGHLYAADMRGLIQVWNSTTWHLDDTLDRGYQPFLLRRLVVTPDGRKAFFSGRDLPVTLWDRVTRQVTRLVNYTATHEADTAGHILLGLDISRDGSRLAAYGSYKLLTDVGAQVLYDGALELWSVDDGRPVHTFQLATGHFPFQGTISFSADISTLAVGAQSYVIWYYDTETGEIFHNGPVGLLMESLCYSRDGSMIAAVGYTNGVRLFDPVSDTLIVRLDDDSTDNACVAISPDNRRVVAGDFSGAVRIWARADASSVERAARADGAVSLDCRRDGSSIVVDYVLPRAGDVRIVLCDLLGREVMAVDEGTVGEGHHVSRLDVAGVPSGPYLCALRTGRESVARRVSIVH